MNRRSGDQLGRLVIATVVALAACVAAVAALPSTSPAGRPASRGVVSTTRYLGPDVVVMKELQSLYQPVPFDHKTHAQMAEMWDGCITCHHRAPDAATRPATLPSGRHPATQAQASQYPACKNCHQPGPERAEIHMPSLKGAYHRQCLNCHREWSGANDCVICHQAIDAGVSAVAPKPPTRDDIVGRMHPPLNPPINKQYRTRFTPADGANVLFRHETHVNAYGLTCVSCHFKDNCANCHNQNARHAEAHVVKPAETWRQSHMPCLVCHEQTRCRECHHKDEQAPPPPFDHRVTGQALDKDHQGLKCLQCHREIRSRDQIGCGGAACHKRGDLVGFPQYRPGPLAPRSRVFESSGLVPDPARTSSRPTTGPR